MNYYIYRFINNDNIIYVGKTINLDQRMYIHFTRGHLPLVCYEQVDTIQYIECTNNTDMSMKELYFINKYKPIYNNTHKSENDVMVISEFESIEWINEYKFNTTDNKTNDIISHYDSIIKDLKSERDSLICKMQKFISDNDRHMYLANNYKKLLNATNSSNINDIKSKIRVIENDPYWRSKK